MADLTSLSKIISDLTVFMSDLSVLEQEKLDSVRKKDLKALDDCMKRQQAQVLRLRGLDRTREKIAIDLGLAGLSLDDILLKYPDDIELHQKAVVLQNEKKNFHSINNCTKKAIEVNLHMIKKQAQEQGLSENTPLKDGSIFKNNSV